MTLLRAAACTAQQEMSSCKFGALMTLVRSCNGDAFTDPAYENRKGFWDLLKALVTVQDRELASKVEASACWGLQVDESTDAGGSSNMIFFLHFEVCCML